MSLLCRTRSALPVYRHIQSRRHSNNYNTKNRRIGNPRKTAVPATVSAAKDTFAETVRFEDVMVAKNRTLEYMGDNSLRLYDVLGWREVGSIHTLGRFELSPYSLYCSSIMDCTSQVWEGVLELSSWNRGVKGKSLRLDYILFPIYMEVDM